MIITFEIDLDGTIKTDVEGGNGLDCLEETQPYEQALSNDDPDREMKPEASEINQFNITSQRLQQGL